jgi:hypothetical protein
MNFLSILLGLSPDQMRLSNNFGDNFVYDQATLFNKYVNLNNLPFLLNANAKETIPLLEKLYPQLENNTTLGNIFLTDTGFLSHIVLSLANLFIQLFTVSTYSGTPLVSVIGLVTLGFLFNFCISIRIEVSKIRLTFLSFISIIFTFLILLTALQFLNASTPPLYVFNSKSDMHSLALFS